MGNPFIEAAPNDEPNVAKKSSASNPFIDVTPDKSAYTPEMQATIAKLDSRNKVENLKQGLEGGPGFLSDERSPNLNHFISDIARAPEILEPENDSTQNADTDTKGMRFVKGLARGGAGLVGFPATVAREITRENVVPEGLENVPISVPTPLGEIPIPNALKPLAFRLGRAVNEIAVRPSEEHAAEASRIFADPNIPDDEKFAQGGTHAVLAATPILNSMIDTAADRVEQGDTLGAYTELATNAALLKAGVEEGKGALESKKTYTAAVDDLVRAQVDKANASGQTVGNAEIAAARKAIIDSGKPLQDIVDSAAELRKPVEDVPQADAVSAEPTQVPTAEVPKEGPTPVHAPEPIGIDAETGLPIYKRNAPEGVVETKSVEPALDAEMRGADPRLSLSVDATKEAAESGNPNYVARTTEADRIGDAKADISAQTQQKVQFLEHLEPDVRTGLAEGNPEIHDLLAQYFPDDLASNEVANVPRETAAANREVQDVQPSGSRTGTEGIQATGSEGQAGSASEPPVRTPPEAPRGFKRNPERGAVDPELLISPFTGAAKLTKAVGEAAAEGRGVAAAMGNEKKAELPQGGSPPSGGMKFAGGPPNEPLPKYAGSINLERNPAELRKQILDRYSANKPEIDAKYRKNVISNEETKALAKDLKLDKSDIDRLLSKGSTTGQAVSRVEMAKLRDYYASVETETREIGRRYEQTGSVSDLISYQEKLAEASAIHPSVQRNAAEFGRQLQSLKILAEAQRLAKTNSLKAAELLRKELGDVWEQNSREVIDRISRIPEGDVREFNKVLRQYAKFSFGDKLNSFYVANLLSGVQTNVKNFAGNTSMVPIETAVKTLRAGFDPVLAKLQGRERQYFAGEVMASVAGRTQGFKQGLEAARHILRDGMTEQQAAKLEMPRHYEFQGWAKAWNYPGRLLAASDAIFKTTAISGELRAQAVKTAMKEGAKGQSLDARIKQLMESPTDEMVNAAYEQAKFETFTTDPGAFTKAYLHFREGVPPTKAVTPFVNVPLNLLKRGSELTPAGFVEPLRDVAMAKLWEAMGKPEFAKGKMSLKDPRVADAFARATIGTAIAIYAAQKYADGELTGRAPADAGQRDAFLRTRQEYSIKIGKKWVKYTDFGPLAIPFLSVAAIEDARQVNKNFPADKVATEAIGALARGVFEQSFFTGIGNLFDAMGPGRGGSFGDNVSKTFAGYGSGLVPFSGLLRSAKNTIDPVFRQPDNIYERIKSGLPIASQTVPSKLNAFGEEQKGSRLNGIFGFGLRDTKVPNLDIEKEIARLEVTPKTPDKTLNIASRQFDLNRDQQRELTALLGEARKQVLRQLFSNQLEVTVGKGDTRASGTYGELDDEQKRAAINNVLGDAYDAARDEFVTRVNKRKEAVKEKPKKAKLQFVGAE